VKQALLVAYKAPFKKNLPNPGAPVALDLLPRQKQLTEDIRLCIVQKQRVLIRIAVNLDPSLLWHVRHGIFASPAIHLGDVGAQLAARPVPPVVTLHLAGVCASSGRIGRIGRSLLCRELATRAFRTEPADLVCSMTRP
jgi:hypothetical protein